MTEPGCVTSPGQEVTRHREVNDLYNISASGLITIKCLKVTVTKRTNA